VKWYRLAAKQGFANAQNNLGWMYDNGRGGIVRLNRLEPGRAYSMIFLKVACGQGKVGLGRGFGQIARDQIHLHRYGQIRFVAGGINDPSTFKFGTGVFF